MTDRANIMAEFDRTIQEVRRDVAALTAEQLHHTPLGEDWQIATIVAHLATGLAFGRDLSEIARQGDPVNPAMFGKYRATLERARESTLDVLLSAFDAEVATYRAYMDAMSDDEFSRVFPVTMPSGAVRELSGPSSVRQAADHLREHQTQIRDWLARSA